MPRFILKTVGVLFITVLLSAFVFVILAFMPSETSRLSHEVNVCLSVARLEALGDTSKVVIIGGSGCGFGFKSNIIREKLNMPVVNTGTHADLGLCFQLSLVKNYIKDGDCVIVIPEYQQFTDLFYGDAHALTILASLYRRGFRLLSLKQILFLLPQVPSHVEKIIRAGDWAPEENSPYSLYSLNDFGDVTAFSNRHHQDSIRGISPINGYNKDSFKMLADYKQYCEDNGALFFLFPAAYEERAFDMNRQYIQQLSQTLKNNGTPYITDPIWYRFADSLFFDTVYHLTEEGCEIRTKKVLADIESYWEQ